MEGQDQQVPRGRWQRRLRLGECAMTRWLCAVFAQFGLGLVVYVIRLGWWTPGASFWVALVGAVLASIGFWLIGWAIERWARLARQGTSR